MGRVVVDTAGRVVLHAFREQWVPGVRRPRGPDAEYHDQFRQAVIVALASMHFRPASVGACKTPQEVQQPFMFRLTR